MIETVLEFLTTRDFPQRIAWGILHSLWLITLLGIIYGGVSLVLTSRYARLRYLFGYAVLLAMIVLPVVTMFVIKPIKPPRPIAFSPPESRTDSQKNHESVLVGAGSVSDRSFEALANVFVTDFEITYSHAIPPTQQPEPQWDLPVDWPIPTAVDAIEPETPEIEASIPIVVPVTKSPRFLLADCVPYLPMVAYAWLFGVALMSIRLGLGLWEIRQLRRKAFLIADGRWEQSLRAAAKRLGLRRKISLRGSVQIASPLMIGVLRPMVLVPLGMLSNLSPEQVEVILMHELAHVRRHDYTGAVLKFQLS